MLRDALRSLLPQAESAPFSVEFVIVDDGSTDDTAEVLCGFVQRARVPVHIVRGEGVGIAAARNLAVVHSNGRWLACCDDDQIADPRWLFYLYDAARRSSADFVGGSMQLALADGFDSADYGPRARRLLGEAGVHRAKGPYSKSELPATNNVLMRADVVRRLGAFNTQFVEGGEDMDLFTRARAAGCKMWFAPSARMQHRIHERRLTRAGLRWSAMRHGACDARNRHTRNRTLGPLGLAGSRTAVLVGRDLPLLAIAVALRHRSLVQDVHCSIWYTRGLLESLPALLRPGTQRSRDFVNFLDFRQRNGERIA